MKRSTYWSWTLAASLPVLMALGLFSLLRSGVRESRLPFHRAAFWVRRGMTDRVVNLFAKMDMAARQADLDREIMRLRQAEAEFERTAEENRRLRALLGFRAPTPWRTVDAPVLARGGVTGWWRSIHLGKGAEDGVAVGDPVVVPEGLIGRVVAVSSHTCDVLLLTDPNSRVACELEGSPDGGTAIRGVLYGAGGRGGTRGGLTLLYVADPLRMRYLRRDAQPAPLTRVITSGLGDGLPRGLAVGYLLASRVSADGLYREADVSPAADLARLDVVFVLARGEARP